MTATRTLTTIVLAGISLIFSDHLILLLSGNARKFGTTNMAQKEKDIEEEAKIEEFFNEDFIPTRSNPVRAVKELTNNTNKTLVIVLGNLRGGEKAWESLYTNVLDINNADLALLIGWRNGSNLDLLLEDQQRRKQQQQQQQQNGSKLDSLIENQQHKQQQQLQFQKQPSSYNASMYQRASYIWEFPEYEDWSYAIDLMGHSKEETGLVSWRNIARKNCNGTGKIFGGTRSCPEGSGAINYSLRYFLSLRINALNLTKRYNKFIITRSDHYYLCPHNLNDLYPSANNGNSTYYGIDSSSSSSNNNNNSNSNSKQNEEKAIWLPYGEDYGGFADRHIVCTNETILDVINIFPPLIYHPSKYINKINIKTNPERLTKLRWDEMNITQYVKRFNRTMFLVATTQDATRWRKVHYWFPNNTVTMELNNKNLSGIGVKYWKEYTLTKKTCSSSKS